jgi:glycine cleavage system aminomethyltransferase T
VITDADLSNRGLPVAHRACTISHRWHGEALALRLNYVGELGWELHVPERAACANVHARLVARGKRASRSAHFGLYAHREPAAREVLSQLEVPT